MNIDHEQRTAPREFNLAPDQHHIDYLRSLLQALAQSDGLTVRRFRGHNTNANQVFMCVSVGSVFRYLMAVNALGRADVAT